MIIQILEEMKNIGFDCGNEYNVILLGLQDWLTASTSSLMGVQRSCGEMTGSLCYEFLGLRPLIRPRISFEIE